MQIVQQRIALGQQTLAVSARVNQGGGIGQHRQQRSLSPAQCRRLPAEITPGRGTQSDDIATKRGAAGVLDQQVVLAEVPLQLQGEQRFAGFLRQSSGRVIAQQPRQLHGERGAATDHPPGAGIEPGRAGNGQWIDTGVDKKAFVFVAQQGLAIFIRQSFHRHKAPLFIRRNAGTKQTVMPVQHQGGVRGVGEPIRQRPELQCGQNGHSNHQQSQDDTAQESHRGWEPIAKACVGLRLRLTRPTAGLLHVGRISLKA